jgi:D-arginine dehydrogenase
LHGAALCHIDVAEIIVESYDFIIIGGGMAGASLGAQLAPYARVALLEGEAQPGSHATGRSAAFWHMSLGSAPVQALTLASGEDLHALEVLQPMGALEIAGAADAAAVEAFVARHPAPDTLARVDPHSLVPGLNAKYVHGVLEQDCAAIDVAKLHQHYLRAFTHANGSLHCNARAQAAHFDGAMWQVQTQDGRHIMAHTLINAAGAWADEAAVRCHVRPLNIKPLRRTIVHIRTGCPIPEAMPAIHDLHLRFYFKREGAYILWLCPCDEGESAPCDATPDALDVAMAMQHFHATLDWPLEAVEHTWAGLRSFAPDRLPVFGFAPDNPRFFWCAGQGGFGIQTAPAAAKLCAELLGVAHKGFALEAGLNAEQFSPSRFTQARRAPAE